MINTSTQVIISFTLVAITSILSLSIYNYNDRILLTKNIELAMNKGVDPMSVRCSYAIADDAVCVAYTLTVKNEVKPVERKK